MNLKLAENIKVLRKKNKLTQEQLAEALHVTAGAVYKWEAKLSTPDLQLIVEMADFFDLSVDVLLGYELRDNSRKELVDRLHAFIHHRDNENWKLEADKALQKYPNNFDIVYYCGELYRIRGIEHHDKELLTRALELLEHARLLIDQNTDEDISDLEIQIDMAYIHVGLDADDKAVDLLKGNNPCHINNSAIGFFLASSCNKPNEAVPYLSSALVNSISTLFQTAIGFVNVYYKQKDYATAIDVLLWFLPIMKGLKRENETNFLEKTEATLWGVLAMMHFYNEDSTQAKYAFRKAKEVALAFDAAPTYDANTIRYVQICKPTSAIDDIGDTAIQGIQKVVDEEDNTTIQKLWEEIKHEPIE